MTAQLEHILYVDDEASIQEVAQMCLEMVGGYRVTCLQNGADVIARAETINPDLILLDVMMPGMDGPSTLRGLRKNSKLDTIPIVFMTARAQPEEIEQYLKMGAAGVVAKPFDPMEIGDQIKNIWESVHGMER